MSDAALEGTPASSSMPVVQRPQPLMGLLLTVFFLVFLMLLVLGWTLTFGDALSQTSNSK